MGGVGGAGVELGFQGVGDVHGGLREVLGKYPGGLGFGFADGVGCVPVPRYLRVGVGDIEDGADYLQMIGVGTEGLWREDHVGLPGFEQAGEVGTLRTPGSSPPSTNSTPTGNRVMNESRYACSAKFDGAPLGAREFLESVSVCGFILHNFTRLAVEATILLRVV